MLRVIAALGFLLTLTSCALPPVEVAERLRQLCGAYASAGLVAASLRADGKLDAGDLARIGRVRLVVDPICLSTGPPAGDLNGLIDQVERGLFRLQGVNARAGT